VVQLADGVISAEGIQRTRIIGSFDQTLPDRIRSEYRREAEIGGRESTPLVIQSREAETQRVLHRLERPLA